MDYFDELVSGLQKASAGTYVFSFLGVAAAFGLVFWYSVKTTSHPKRDEEAERKRIAEKATKDVW